MGYILGGVNPSRTPPKTCWALIMEGSIRHVWNQLTDNVLIY
jgi:hypothetical protein